MLTANKLRADSRLTVTPLSGVASAARGQRIRVEGYARSEPVLPGPGGTSLAYQRARFRSTVRGKNSREKSGYDRAKPESFFLRSDQSSAANEATVIFTSTIGLFLPEIRCELAGNATEIERRINAVISPTFSDYRYTEVSGNVMSSWLELWTVPQGSRVTVLGFLEGGPQSPAFFRADAIVVGSAQEFTDGMNKRMSRLFNQGTLLLATGVLVLAVAVAFLWRASRAGRRLAAG